MTDQTNPSPAIDLEIDRENVMLDDYLMLVEMTNFEKLDPTANDYQAKVKERASKERDVFAMLDRLVVGGIRNRGIKLSQLGAIVQAVFSAIGNNQDLKN